MTFTVRCSAMVYRVDPVAVAWFKKLFHLDKYGAAHGELLRELTTTEGELSRYDVFDWPGFDYVFRDDGEYTDLQITDRDGYFNSKHIFALMQTYFTKFRPFSYISVHYTHGREKPIDGSFWGGCYFITKDYVKSASMHDWEASQIVRWSTLDI